MLKPNHVKALELLRDNVLSVKDIAKACSISINYLYDLIECQPNTGKTGVEFSQEYKKIRTECSKRTKSNIVTLKDRLIEDLMRWNNSLPKNPKRLTLKEIYAKRAILGELNKATEGVEIGEFHYHTGLGGEDLIDEFKRIKTLVQLAADGRGVQTASEGRAGDLSFSPEAEAGGAEEDKTPPVSPESETGDLPPQ